MNGERAEEMLEALGEILDSREGEPWDVVVCGGMALILLGIVARHTLDVDALGVVAVTAGGLEVVRPASNPGLAEAVRRVGGLFDAQPDWFNFGAANQLEMTMPEGLVERAVVKTYGNKLTVRLCSRFDMVHLKMMAALDRGEEQTVDLFAMKPTAEEADAAARWCLAQGCSAYRLKTMLEELGHEDVSRTL